MHLSSNSSILFSNIFVFSICRAAIAKAAPANPKAAAPSIQKVFNYNRTEKLLGKLLGKA